MSEYDYDNNDIKSENLEASQSMISTGSEIESREKLKLMVQMILGMGDSQHLDKICCIFRIDKRSSLTKQLTFQFSILLTIFMIIIVACLVFYAKFSPGYVDYTILDLVDQNIEDTLSNSILEFSSQVHLQLRQYNSWLVSFSQILSSNLGWNSTLYETPSEILLQPKLQYFRQDQTIPSDLALSDYSKTSLYAYDVTLKSFQYLALLADDSTSLSSESKAVLDGLDILSYFYESFFFNPSYSFISSMYFYFVERELFCVFPGGMIGEGRVDGFQPTSRPWYINTVETFEENEQQAVPTISGPYFEYQTTIFRVAISLPIMKKDSPTTIAALINIDVNLGSFQQIYNSSLLSTETMTVAFIDLTTDLIVNDCYQTGTTISLYETSITNLTYGNWLEILDFNAHPVNSTFYITDVYANQYYVSRTLIKTIFVTNDTNFILIAFGRQLEYLSYRNQISDQLDLRIYSYSVTLLICFGIIWFLGYFYIYFLAKSIVQPITQLSNLAKGINKNEGKKDPTENLKQQLGSLKSPDENTRQLVESFLNLVNQHSGMKRIRLASQYMDQVATAVPTQSQTITCLPYPKNDIFEQLEEIRDEVSQLRNLGTNQEGSETIQEKERIRNEKDDRETESENDEMQSCSSMPSARGFSEKDPSIEDESVLEMYQVKKRRMLLNLQIQSEIKKFQSKKITAVEYSNMLLREILPAQPSII